MMVLLAQEAVHLVTDYKNTDQLFLISKHYDKIQGYFHHFVNTLNFLSESTISASKTAD